jgi:hypothetical protein
MKKLIAMVLALIMMLSMAACTAGKTNETTDDQADIFSKYPADINEWTSENFNAYFKDMGVYTDDKWAYVQDHETYYAGTPVDTCSGYMDDTGLYFTAVFIVNPDSTEGDGKAMLEHIRTNKSFPEELNNLPVDHLAGNVAFFYSFSSDEEFYNKFDAAVKQLFEKLGVTPDF